MAVLAHPWFQRLRHIKQMGMAQLVYPGAVHTRLHHSLGACHLMQEALYILRTKGIKFSDEEALGARLAILLHDVGHGPFSHALEHVFVSGISHEEISLMIMRKLDQEMAGALGTAIQIFQGQYSSKFLHQLVSSQLDMDRMDYLNRDSFFTGVSEGVIGYDRILEMLTVQHEELMVEEKAVHSVEKFIIARRLMYWQVYLHKTVLGAELLIINILKRARAIAEQGTTLFCTPALHHFLYNKISEQEFKENPKHLEAYCALDDNDITASIKVWQNEKDPILSRLCRMLVQRKLYKVKLSSGSLNDELATKKLRAQSLLNTTDEQTINYFVFGGSTKSSTYNLDDERIQIALKTGKTCDISDVEDPLVSKALARPVVKNYICYLNE
ncbi:MAG: HD domain-containing protein [Bacteroidetes bacterium]|nr:HD domain-containing protein [Bacteroidota bacterium]